MTMLGRAVEASNRPACSVFSATGHRTALKESLVAARMYRSARLGERMGRTADHLTTGQFDLLTWVADECRDGVYEGTAHRVSARALHNRGLIRVAGRGDTWTATITPEGTRRLKEQAERIKAERDREAREEAARAERERKQQRLCERATEVLNDVVAAGGRLELGADVGDREIEQWESLLAQDGLLPEGKRLTHEPTRMDPDLGITAYLEPDFTALTPTRVFRVPRQLRGPHPAVAAFQDKRAHVTKPQIGRAARFLQAVITAAGEMGWKVSKKVLTAYSGGYSGGYGGRGVSPDLPLSLPSGEVVVTIRELDQRGRTGYAFITDTDYYTRTQRTVANKSFAASGRLEVTVSKAWGEQQPILALRDAPGASLEEQLPVLVRTLEIAEAEAQWVRQEEGRRAEIRQTRWEEVKQEAFTRLSYQRNIERLHDELTRRENVSAMRAYAEEVDARSNDLTGPDGHAARAWAEWIRNHAERIDPLNGDLCATRVTSASHEELQSHMNGWSTYGPHRG
ncbi:MAG: hypothetical protein QM572_03750 [Nocardioides sp.]|uniref:hypothetical protein n=1 Tax=Nocardioides sp. TaxID=35761 RepID=UPI0039E33369